MCGLLVPHDNIQSAIDEWKSQVQAVTQQNSSPLQHQLRKRRKAGEERRGEERRGEEERRRKKKGKERKGKKIEKKRKKND
jgi:hypothetical protein